MEKLPSWNRRPRKSHRICRRNTGRSSITRPGYANDVAVDELLQGFTKKYHGSDVEIANEFVEAAMLEFDDLDCATAQRKHGTSKSDWDNWRTEWCKLRGLPREKA